MRFVTVQRDSLHVAGPRDSVSTASGRVRLQSTAFSASGHERCPKFRVRVSSPGGTWGVMSRGATRSAGFVAHLALAETREPTRLCDDAAFLLTPPLNREPA